MIFSYGFLENDRAEAKQIFLDMDIPVDDPLAVVKKMFCQDALGVRLSTIRDSDQPSTISDSTQQIFWDSPLVWWACVNEEDGLHVSLAQTTDGRRELDTSWKGEKIYSAHHLQDLLAADPSWDIFQLRAVVLLLARLETQLSLLEETEEIMTNLLENRAVLSNIFRPGVFALISRFRALEAGLLEKAVAELMRQVSLYPYSQPSSKDYR